ncbi:unnamed protein product, partial [Symbiodinium sp. CCMP2456]
GHLRAWMGCDEEGRLSQPTSKAARLWTAKRWIVHLYAGAVGHYQMFQLDEGDTAVIELDLERNKAHDIQRDSTWRMLMWGALTGRIEAVVGGPPGRSGLPRWDQKATRKDVRNLALVARMLWLYAVAEAARTTSSAVPLNRQRPVAFMVEHPAEENWVDGHTSTTSLWTTPTWRAFAEEMGMASVTFDQGVMGATTTSVTTLGTNIYYLMGLDAMRKESVDDEACAKPVASTWSSGLVDAVALALQLWRRHPKEIPRMAALTAAQWKEHVASGHAKYHRECLTCVMSRGTGRRHARVRHPDMFTLTTDVAGPIKPGLDVSSKGALGKGLRYFLIGKYTLPREYVKAYSGREPPRDDGMGRPQEAKATDGEELSGPSLLPPRDEGDVCEEEPQEAKATDGEELAGPSLLPPGDEGDPFILDDDESGEQVPMLDTDDEPGEQGHKTDEFEDYEDSMYEPSVVDTEEAGEGDLRGVESQRSTIQDCEPPEATVLLFAKPLKNNTSASVKAALQDIVLYLETHNLPVYRHHADHGETFSHGIRSWFREQGIRATWSEAGVPQGNGRAESAVRWIKDRARTLLVGARMPTKLWPTAVEAATATQRASVLGWKSKLMAPYGAPVHIKQKVFDSSGPRRRERAFESRWLKGYYMGLSNLLDDGHVIYVPGTEGGKEKFIHTFHVRTKLQDPGPPEQELQLGDEPRPRRKIPIKTPAAEVEMRALNFTRADLEEYAIQRSRALLDQWSYEEALRLVDELAEAKFFDDRTFGIWRHGGAVGWTTAFKELPEVAKVLAKLVVEVDSEATFTAICVMRNTQRGQHRDSNNDEKANNYLVPVRLPRSGGGLWVELTSGDRVCGQVVERSDDKGTRRYGQVLTFEMGKCTTFSPRKRHEVLPWEGTRTMMIAYTPQAMGKITQDMVQQLEDHGYVPPLSQLPEYFLSEEHRAPKVHLIDVVEEKSRAPAVNVINAAEEEVYQEDLTPIASDVQEWDMFLEVEGGMVRVTPEAKALLQPRVAKVEVNYTPDIEAVINGLKGPLEVTHTVDPRDAMAHLSLWKDAIVKEMNTVEVAIARLQVGTPERREWLQHPRAQRLPTKMVFTIKPNPKAELSDRATWVKRKVRLVVCGNFAASETMSLYTEAAPSEAVRTGLVIAKREGWSVGIIDIVAAFLKTPIGNDVGDPVIIATPPKLLQELNLIQAHELWRLVRALYGLRQSPVLWSRHRDRRMEAMKLPAGLAMTRGRTISSWWSVRDARGRLSAVILIYVDDYLILGPRRVIQMLTDMIQQEWDTSDLSILSEENAVKFLGMELTVRGEEWYLSQQGYIEELIRAYELQPGDQSRIPIAKDDAVYEVLPDDQPPTEQLIHQAQHMTGELLWLSQRSRPDLSFGCCVLSSMSTRTPARVVAMAYKMLKYINYTRTYQLRIKWAGNHMYLYPDAAFAPGAARSQTGWVITYGGTPILWRSSRQSTTALSSAEAELNAILEGSVAMLGVEAMLMDMNEFAEDKIVGSDSLSALSLSAGTGSWRTRHLRIKAAWLQEAISSEIIKSIHVPGVRQPADLLTKALSGERIRALLSIWGMGEYKKTTQGGAGTTSTAAARAFYGYDLLHYDGDS